MNTSARDGDQPGLWPLSETGKKHTTTGATNTQRATQALPRRRAAGSQTQRSAPVEVANLWCIDDVAHYLGVPKDTIYGWRKTNYGPPAIKVGKHLRWRPAAVVEWARKQELSAG